MMAHDEEVRLGALRNLVLDDASHEHNEVAASISLQSHSRSLHREVEVPSRHLLGVPGTSNRNDPLDSKVKVRHFDGGSADREHTVTFWDRSHFLDATESWHQWQSLRDFAAEM